MNSPKPVLHLDVVDIGRTLPKLDGPYVRLLARHYDVRISDEPELLIYSDGGEIHRLHSCKKVYWTPEPYRPDFRECDYAITGLWIEDPRHLRQPLYAEWVAAEDLIRRPGELAEWLPRKTEFCCYFSSYVSRRTRHRQRFFERLSRYRQVHAAGRAFNNIGRTIPFEPEAKHAFLSAYKFYMAFENSRLPGYTTEKIVEAWRARCIPIYWGNPRIAEDFNPRSFINAHDFPDEDRLIEHIIRVDQDPDLYARYLEEPCFPGNEPSCYFQPERVLGFLRRVIEDPRPPLATRRRRWTGRWRLVKRNRDYQPAPEDGRAGRPMGPQEVQRRRDVAVSLRSVS